MRFRFLVKRSSQGERVRDPRVYDDEPPAERDVLEITVGRDRMKVRVLSVHWADRTGVTPAEVIVEEIR
jgi:hypothetical protein